MPKYWVGGSGNTNDTAHWSNSDGGPGGATVPGSTDNVIFNASSDSGAGFTVTVNAAFTCADFDNTAVDQVMTLAGTAAWDLYGSLAIKSTTVWNYTGTGGSACPGFKATSTGKTITTNGVAVGGFWDFNGVGGGWTFQDALNLNNGSARTLTLTNGALDLNGFTVTTGRFISNFTNTRTLAFGSGKLVVIGQNATIFDVTATSLTVTGTPIVEFDNSSATGTRTFTTTSFNEAKAFTFKVKNGSDTVSSGSVNKTLDFTGFTGTISNIARTIYGDLTIPSGATLSAGASATTFGATSGTQTVTTNGKTLDFPLTFNGAGGTFTLGGALTIGSTRLATLTNGTLNLAGYTFTTGTFATATGTKNLTANGGSLVVVGSGSTAFNNAQPTNFTTTAGTGNGVIELTNASAKTFVGGGSTYAFAIRVSGGGALSVTGANTFAGASNDNSAAQSILFTASTTTTFTVAPTWAGAATKLMTIGSITAAGHTLSLSAGTVSNDYLSISRSTATGGASWYAGANSTDGSNNSGWIFTAPPVAGNDTGAFLQFMAA